MNPMTAINERIRQLNFGQHAQFIVHLRAIAGNGWECVDDCQPEDIDEAINRTLNP